MKKLYLLTITLGFVLALSSRNANAVELISNGGFETGTFAGWTVFDEAGGSGSWYVDDADGLTPFSGQLTVGPAAGNFYAVSDQGGPGAHALEQTFTVPLGATSVILSFDMFINDWDGGPVVNPAGLTYTAGSNQHARVDIMLPIALPLSTAPADIVANLVAPTVDLGPDPNPYAPYVFDITGVVVPGATYKLRFAEVDNQLFFNQGVDNVSINVVPEPSTFTLLMLGFAGILNSRRTTNSR